jgi:peptidoglycan hydrolase-like protein with peptidoglycan-binding domain
VDIKRPNRNKAAGGLLSLGMVRRRILRLAAPALCALAINPATAGAQTGGSPPTGGAPTSGDTSPFAGSGMWIWIMSRTEGGNLQRIADKAALYGIKTLYIKNGDGTNAWPQFSSDMVRFFHLHGLKVCGWQYVYGAKPVGEALVSAAAKDRGADCFVIDAESEYEGKYVAADQYIRKLRALVGPSFPLSLAGFPYVDYHPSFPYSVMMGPGFATVNQPQMYWKAIGVSPDDNFAHTYIHNRVYNRAIYPLGQTYDGAPVNQIKRFRQLAKAYGAPAPSWWVWTETTTPQWQALATEPATPATPIQAVKAYPRLGLRAKGDQVIWAQALLLAHGRQVAVDGIYGPLMTAAVSQFQSVKGLSQTGVLDDATWLQLLTRSPVSVRWRAITVTKTVTVTRYVGTGKNRKRTRVQVHLKSVVVKAYVARKASGARGARAAGARTRLVEVGTLRSGRRARRNQLR